MYDRVLCVRPTCRLEVYLFVTMYPTALAIVVVGWLVCQASCLAPFHHNACCRTEGAHDMCQKAGAQSNMWSSMAVALKEPYLLKHGFSSHVTGSVVVINKFTECLEQQVVNNVKNQLALQVWDYEKRAGFSCRQGRVVPGVLMEVFEELIQGVLAHARKTPTDPGLKPVFYMPCGRIHDTRNHIRWSIVIYPIISVVLAQTAVDRVFRMVSVHAGTPLRPGVVLSASDLLSRSFKPGNRRLLVHCTYGDNVSDEETVAANEVLWSAIVDVARSDETGIHDGMLHHGAQMQRLKDDVASREGWALRHVRMRYDPAAGPPLQHPCGDVDEMCIGCEKCA